MPPSGGGEEKLISDKFLSYIQDTEIQCLEVLE